MCKKRQANGTPKKAVRDAQWKEMQATLAGIESETEALAPGQVGFSSKAPPILSFIDKVQFTAIIFAFLVLTVGVVWGGFWMLGKGIDAAEHYELAHRALLLGPEYACQAGCVYSN
jgi:hypothetical protein